MDSARLRALQRSFSTGGGLDLDRLMYSHSHLQEALTGFQTYFEDLSTVSRSAHEIPPDLQDIVDGYEAGRHSLSQVQSMALEMLDAERVVLDSWSGKLRVMNLQLVTEETRRCNNRPEVPAPDKFMSTIDEARLEFHARESTSLLALCKRALAIVDRQTKYWTELDPSNPPPSKEVPPESPTKTSKPTKKQKKRKGKK